MIKFAGCSDKGIVIGFGLSRENVDRLVKGEPIVADTQALGLPPGKVLIFFGETEEAMEADLKKIGFIGPQTTIVR